VLVGGNLSDAAREATIERDYLKKLLRKHGMRDALGRERRR
jgi:hypothetical protein